MACCNECEQSGLGCCNQGLGQVGTVTTGSYVVAGSIIEWGGYLRASDVGAIYPFTEYWQDMIEGCLYQTGGFSSVQVSKVAGWVNDYVGIRVEVANDFGRLEDVFNLIVGQLSYCVGIYPDSRAFWVLSTPPSVQGNNQYAQPGAGGSSNSGSQENSSPWWPFGGSSNSGNGSECDWLKQSWADYLACQLGIKPSQAAFAGIVIGLVGVIAIGKVVK